MLIGDGLSADRWDELPLTDGAGRRSPKRPAAIAFFVALALAWLVCDILVLAPAFGGLDIYYFKDPGANFAQGLGFVSRFTYGNPSLQYHTYSQYPPVYPFLYGVFASAFGVTLTSNQAFNSIIDLGCGIVGFVAMWPLLRDFGGHAKWRRLAPLLQTAIFVASIVTGFFKPEQDRPDALAVLTGGVALLLIRERVTNMRLFMSCALCALTFFISPFTSIWAAIALFMVTAAAVHADRRDFAAMIRLAASAGAGGTLVAILALSLIAVFLPDWFGGFSGVVTGASTRNETGGGYFMLLLHGDVRGWAGAFREFTRNGAGTLYINLGKLLLVEVTLAVAAIWEWWRAKASGERWQGLWIVGLVLASPLCLIITPYQFTYLRITAALLLMAAACVTARMRRPAMLPYTLAIVIAYAGIAITTIPKTFIELASRAVDAPSLNRAETYIRSHRFGTDRRGGFLAVSPSTYMLWRQEGIRPLATVFSGFENADARRHVDTIALSYARSVDPLTPEFPEWYAGGEFRQEYAPNLPQTYKLAGIPIGSGNITWESAIFTQQAH